MIKCTTFCFKFLVMKNNECIASDKTAKINEQYPPIKKIYLTKSKNCRKKLWFNN